MNSFGFLEYCGRSSVGGENSNGRLVPIQGYENRGGGSKYDSRMNFLRDSFETANHRHIISV
jgi:hypothetical protein